MALNVAFQMDAPESFDIAMDTSFALALSAQERGSNLFYYQAHELSLIGGRVFAPLRPMWLQRVEGEHVRLQPPQKTLLEDMDVVMMRQDPPFDMGYITATHLLEHVGGGVLVVNDPRSVRNAPEKLLVMQFADLMPPTIISREYEEIEVFRRQIGDIVVKPLFGSGGEGVLYFTREDMNLAAYVEVMSGVLGGRLPLIAQAFVPRVREGDKRILLVEGEVIGAINRRPQKGAIRANMHVGATPERAVLTERDRQICERLRPILREMRLLLVGIDVIDGFLTEINVTSPTGLQELSRFDEIDGAGRVWDAIEGRLQK